MFFFETVILYKADVRAPYAKSMVDVGTGYSYEKCLHGVRSVDISPSTSQGVLL